MLPNITNKPLSKIQNINPCLEYVPSGNDSRDDRPRGSRDSRDQKKDEWNTTPQQRKIATNIDISKLQQGSQVCY